MPELGGQQPAEEESPQPARMMNTERQRQRPVPEPIVLEPEARPEPGPPAGKERPVKRNQLLEQIVSAGRDVAGDDPMASQGDEVEPAAELPDLKRPMSSAEMIARAHERWDSKPR